MMDNSTNKAIAYSLLAHIRNEGTLTKGPLELFIPIVKKGLHFMNINKDQYKGESINEIKNIIFDTYGIEFPIPVLKSILSIIAKEINSENETVFVLNRDNSFWIKDFVFEDYDQKIQEYKNVVTNLQTLFVAFCEANGIDKKENNCIIKFIERNKISISKYLANAHVENGSDFIIEAKFVEYFKHNSLVFSQIKNIYLGSILTCYLEYQPSNVKMDVILLFDTNFIISLLDLNTPESTHTCRKLLQVCKNLGYSFRILIDTIDETKSLLNHKASGYDSAIILKYVNREDIYNACERRSLSKADLDRIADNLEKALSEFGITIIPYSENLRNKAKHSSEYELLKKLRNSPKAALHDAEAILYVKEKRGRKIKEFEKINCWFVNNAISHDTDNDNINLLLNPKYFEHQPEIIKVDDLLNVLWLSNPNIGSAIANDELVDIGITSLVAFTLNEALPKARIIKELDANIQKYKNETISDRDILLLSTRIANGQFKNLERLNELAITDPARFNEGIKKEARKQEVIERERTDKFEDLFKKMEEKYTEIADYKGDIEKEKDNEVKKIKELSKQELSNKELEIKILKIENIKTENKLRETKRELLIAMELKKWRTKSWIAFMIFGVIVIFAITWIILAFDYSPKKPDSLFDIIIQSKVFSILISVITFLMNTFVVKALYDKYFNHSNINAFKSNIIIPIDLKNVPLENHGD